MRWKDFLYYQTGTKIAIILLLILIVLTLILNILLKSSNTSDIVMMQNDSIIQDFKATKDSLIVVEKLNNKSDNVYKKYDSVNNQKEQEKRESTHSVQPHNYSEIHNYREDNDIDENKEAVSDNYTNHPSYQKIEKLSPGQTISLNDTDTTSWKKIPGIGSSYSSRIIKYRNLLGGFFSKEQLLEVYGIDNEMYTKIHPFIEEDSKITKLNINKLEFKELLRHPYLNYKQVKIIVNLRQKKGDITSIEELAMLDEFTSEDIYRLKPYLEF